MVTVRIVTDFINAIEESGYVNFFNDLFFKIFCFVYILNHVSFS